MTEKEMKTLILVKKLEGQIRQRNKKVKQLQFEISELKHALHKFQEDSEELNKLRKMFASFLFQGAEFQDAVIDILVAHLEIELIEIEMRKEK